jgi:hypothetical protein
VFALYIDPTGDNDMPAFQEPLISEVSDFPPQREARGHDLTQWIRQLIASQDRLALALERSQHSAEQLYEANSVDRAERLCDLAEKVLLERTGCINIPHRTQVARIKASIDRHQEQDAATNIRRDDSTGSLLNDGEWKERGRDTEDKFYNNSIP